MKINFDVVLKDLDGEVIEAGLNSDQIVNKIAMHLQTHDSITKKEIDEMLIKSKPLDLKGAAKTVLTMSFQDEKELTGDVKLDRYVLACKIRSGGECDLTVEDIALIKKLIGKAYGPLIVGQAWQLLEGKTEG